MPGGAHVEQVAQQLAVAGDLLAPFGAPSKAFSAFSLRRLRRALNQPRTSSSRA